MRTGGAPGALVLVACWPVTANAQVQPKEPEPHRAGPGLRFPSSITAGVPNQSHAAHDLPSYESRTGRRMSHETTCWCEQMTEPGSGEQGSGPEAVSGRRVQEDVLDHIERRLTHEQGSGSGPDFCDRSMYAGITSVHAFCQVFLNYGVTCAMMPATAAGLLPWAHYTWLAHGDCLKCLSSTASKFGVCASRRTGLRHKWAGYLS